LNNNYMIGNLLRYIHRINITDALSSYPTLIDRR